MLAAHQPLRVISLVVLAFSLLVAGCSSSPHRESEAEQRARAALYQQYQQWRGVPYRLGGNGKGGVDCSALVQITYRNALARDLPRTTKEQARVGSKIKPGKERAGDLVFFKTGWWGRHVGIYLEDGKFMHASTSGGVTISSLHDPYWSKHYWKSRRP